MTTVSAPRPSGSGSNTTPAQKRNWLAEIRTAVKPRPTAAVFYGVPGVGKTSFAANAPGAGFLTDDKEDGITTLKANGLVSASIPQLPSAKSWLDVTGILDALATGDHAIKTLVVDALGGVERLCHEEVCRRDYKNDWGERGFGSYQKGFDTALADWRLLINAFDRLRDERQMGIIILAHARVSTFKNPEGADYDRYAPDVHAKTWALTHKWADIVGFMNFYTVVEGGNSTRKGKASGGQQRILYTEHHATYEAKNRHGLPTEIDLGSNAAEGWNNFAAAMKAARANNTTNEQGA